MIRLVLSILAAICCASPAFAADAAGTREQPAGMLGWPDGEMINALDIFIPQRMAELEVPGVSLAIVKDGKLVYAQGYGVADRKSGTPVTPDTLFDAGALGMPVAAYGAMRLVEDKKLFLNAPLSRDMRVPWLAQEEDHKTVTLRQVLTHTSGLSDHLTERSHETEFAPGSGFAFSGVGFMYLQAAMEEVAGQPFDRYMRQAVFVPLDMNSSGYALPAVFADKVARGHVHLSYPVLLFYVPFLLSFAILVLIVWFILRFVLERPKFYLRDMIVPAVLSVVAAIVLTVLIVGPRDVWFVLGWSAAYAAGLGAVVLVGGLLHWWIERRRDLHGIVRMGQETSRPTALALALLAGVVISLPVLQRDVTAPAHPFGQANAASSLRTTAGDLARFMVELMAPRATDPKTVARMLGETVPVGGDIEWGLGIGVRRTLAGETFWHWGGAPGFQSLMVFDPEIRGGVVILTNSDEGAELVQEVAVHVMGQTPGWGIP